MTLTREQFVKNSAWTLFELTLYPVLLILATPVFIAKLGIEQYGLWMLVTTVTQLINLLNIGVGDSNIRLISQYRASNLEDQIRKVFRYNFSLSLFLFLMAVLAGALFYHFDFISLFYKTNDYSLANKVLFLVCLSWGAKFVEAAVVAVFKAFERFDLNSRLSLLSKNSVVVCNLVMVAVGRGLFEVVLLTFILNVFNVILQLIMLHRFNKRILSWPNLSFFRESVSNINYNFWYWLQASIALLGFLTDKMAVAWFTDVKTLGYYYIASMIGANIHNFFLAFGGFIFPRVSYRLAGSHDLRPLYFVSRSLIALPGWLITLALITIGDPVFKLWLGPETFVNSIYFIKLYLVFEAGMMLIIVPFHFINGTSKIKLNSVFELVIRLSHFTAMMVGYYAGGVNGIVYGLIISTLVNVPFQYFYFHREVIGIVGSYQFLLVIVPVVVLPGLIVSGSIFFHVTLILAFVILCKLIYFDPGRRYTKDIVAAAKTRR